MFQKTKLLERKNNKNLLTEIEYIYIYHLWEFSDKGHGARSYVLGGMEHKGRHAFVSGCQQMGHGLATVFDHEVLTGSHVLFVQSRISNGSLWCQE
jgi:hypothetical protein